jgi:hypothetical protein
MKNLSFIPIGVLRTSFQGIFLDLEPMYGHPNEKNPPDQFGRGDFL